MSKKVKRIKVGNKEYSLNDIWKLCLRMWKDIKNESLINIAKERWLEKHGFGDIMDNCFFCEWNRQQGVTTCTHCPGKLVSKRFGCSNCFYHWYHAPKKFYWKLLRLNKKRKNQ